MRKIEFIKAFRSNSFQLNSLAIAGEWIKTAERLAEIGFEVDGHTAARWANRGYMPAEAFAKITGN